jgi:hypothetical protein
MKARCVKGNNNAHLLSVFAQTWGGGVGEMAEGFHALGYQSAEKRNLSKKEEEI